MKHLIAILIFITVTSCSTLVTKVPPASIPDSTGEVSPPIDTPPVGSVTFKPQVKYTTATERAIIEKASVKVNEVIASQCFKDFMQGRSMIETNNRTSSEVYSHIASLSGLVDVLMYFKRWTSAIAYREPPSLKINLNRNYFTASKSVCEWASTMAHEGVTHALGGYSHSFYDNANRNRSVPYSINAGFEKCCK